MGSLREEDNKVFFDNEILIDFKKPILNYSRLPLHQSNPELISLFRVLSLLIRDGDNKDRFGEKTIYKDYYELIYLLISRYMIGIPGTRTTKTVELGADDWALGFHLSILLGAFHSDNEYYLVTDNKDSKYTDFFGKLIESEKSMDKVVLIKHDYDTLPLEEHSFDLVILNGSTVSAAVDDMVRLAVNLVKDGGAIIAFNQFQNTVFEDMYKLKSYDQVKVFSTYKLEDNMAEIVFTELVTRKA